MIIIYIERKRRGDSFWVMRLQDEEKEVFVEDISYIINKNIKEEYRKEYNEAIISIFENAQHDEKYDKSDEQSIIISSSQIADILIRFLELLHVTAENSKERDKLIDTCEELIAEFKKLLIG